MKSLKEYLTEILDVAVPYTLYTNSSNPVYKFVIDGYTYLAGFTYYPTLGGYNFGFAMYKNGTLIQKVTDVGPKVALKVFSTSLDIIKHFIEDRQPDVVVMLADLSEPESKLSVYSKLIGRYLPDNYTYTTKTINFEGSPHLKYTFTKI